ncbi:hypothetical protein E3T35_06150 [Cryobacterium sp. TMT1-2-2]|uniref:hypothetical protein n=1 Tax=Cryobacterium sp. TMT1-2-2 TaxID=1259233 RepID=UPI00106A2A11|nr:hypothetical protein [Cryobacterium sp. TMT1-2-2]TFD12867.1 hypothetical protein E3T35_06150 [Cryobacterium sp. TMT1-2-2]
MTKSLSPSADMLGGGHPLFCVWDFATETFCIEVDTRVLEVAPFGKHFPYFETVLPVARFNPTGEIGFAFVEDGPSGDDYFETSVTVHRISAAGALLGTWNSGVIGIDKAEAMIERLRGGTLAPTPQFSHDV